MRPLPRVSGGSGGRAPVLFGYTQRRSSFRIDTPHTLLSSLRGSLQCAVGSWALRMGARRRLERLLARYVRSKGEEGSEERGRDLIAFVFELGLQNSRQR